jgi:hypothetical protein
MVFLNFISRWGDFTCNRVTLYLAANGAWNYNKNSVAIAGTKTRKVTKNIRFGRGKRHDFLEK